MLIFNRNGSQVEEVYEQMEKTNEANIEENNVIIMRNWNAIVEVIPVWI